MLAVADCAGVRVTVGAAGGSGSAVGVGGGGGAVGDGGRVAEGVGLEIWEPVEVGAAGNWPAGSGTGGPLTQGRVQPPKSQPRIKSQAIRMGEV